MDATVLLLVGIACALLLLSWACQRRMLSAPVGACVGVPPAISILKPLCGEDPGLEANLESFFRLEGRYELILGARDPGDPALAVARRVAARHPHVASRVVTSDRSVGRNPKVDNLAGLAAHASHELLLVSDSNVRVAPSYLRDLVAAMPAEGGLVSSLVRGRAEGGLGAALESLQLNTFVMRGVSTWGGLLGRPCVVGKSMLLPARLLRGIGGFEELGRYLAEDQACGVRVRAAGHRVVVSGRPVDNVLGRVSVGAFVRRHLRWCLLRRHLTAPGYAAEILAEPVGIAVVTAALARSPASLAALAAAWTLATVLAWDSERRLGVTRPWLHYPALVLARGVLVVVLHPVPFLRSHVTWRGNRLRVGPGTRLADARPVRQDAWAPAPESHASPSW